MLSNVLCVVAEVSSCTDTKRPSKLKIFISGPCSEKSLPALRQFLQSGQLVAVPQEMSSIDK